MLGPVDKMDLPWYSSKMFAVLGTCWAIWFRGNSCISNTFIGDISPVLAYVKYSNKQIPHAMYCLFKITDGTKDTYEVKPKIHTEKKINRYRMRDPCIPYLASGKTPITFAQCGTLSQRQNIRRIPFNNVSFSRLSYELITRLLKKPQSHLNITNPVLYLALLHSRLTSICLCCTRRREIFSRSVATSHPLCDSAGSGTYFP